MKSLDPEEWARRYFAACCAVAFVILVATICAVCLLCIGCQQTGTKIAPPAVKVESETKTKPGAQRIVVADLDQLLRDLRVQEIPGIGKLGGWHRKPTVSEIGAIAGEHVTMAQLAEIRRKDAEAAAEIRRQDREGWWLLGVYTLSVLVGFVGLVAALYMRSTMFLVLPAAGLGTSFMAYLFLNAFVWLAWVLIVALAIVAGLGIWYLARHGGIMQVVAGKAVAYAERQKQMLPPNARKSMRTWAKTNHAPTIGAVIDHLRGKAAK
jgi:hypothetical protein